VSIVRSSTCGAGPDDAPPHVLLLTIDTFRPDYMSINGYDRPTTPFLDSLVAAGFYFEEAVSPIARTTPAIASLLRSISAISDHRRASGSGSGLWISTASIPLTRSVRT